jgi:hypothetical protein
MSPRFAVLAALLALASGCDGILVGPGATQSQAQGQCGNAVCEASETCESCPSDCGQCPAFCGDGACNAGETCGSCPHDCGECPASCGDEVCASSENCVTCAADCGACPAGCGDKSCGSVEDCKSCPFDCGTCAPACGDGKCDASETCKTCAADCGACPAFCGDKTCNAGETCGSCPADCGTCTVPAQPEASVAPKTDGGVAPTSDQKTGPVTTAGIPADRLTPWSPGIPSDTLLKLPLGADGLPQRTTVCATLSPGQSIQNAINSCPAGQVVKLGPGTFTVSSTIQLKTGVVLRGSGSDGAAKSGTTIVKTGGSSVIAIGSDEDGPCYGGSMGTAVAVTADAVNGSSTIKVGSAASGFVAGDLAHIDVVDDPAVVQEGDCPYYKRASGRSATQRVEIASVDAAGGTLTLTSPLHWTFKAQSPYLAKIAKMSAQPIRWAGVESVKIEGGTNPGYLGQMAGGIDISNAAYCWVKDVQTGGTIRNMHVALTGAYRCVVRDSYIHHSADYGYAKDCYGVVIRCASADNLIENNIVRYMNKPVLFNTSGGGNVVGYNYVDNAWAEGSWQESPIDCHCSFPHMELMEGNLASKMSATITHGNAGYLMYLRNYSSSQFAAPAIWNGSTTITASIAAMQFDDGDIGMTAFGNVLGAASAGTSPASTGYESGSAPIFLLGPASDPSTTTFVRHGNYDYFNKATKWDPGIADHSIPASLYRTSKPAFFGSLPWPWVGPDLSPMVGTLPAKARSDVSYSPPAP